MADTGPQREAVVERVNALVDDLRASAFETCGHLRSTKRVYTALSAEPKRIVCGDCVHELWPAGLSRDEPCNRCSGTWGDTYRYGLAADTRTPLTVLVTLCALCANDLGMHGWLPPRFGE